MARLDRAEILTRQRSLPYTSSEKRSAPATSWVSMSVPARISITENASLGTAWHRADALVSLDKQDQFREQSVPISCQIGVQEIETAHKNVVSPCFTHPCCTCLIAR